MASTHWNIDDADGNSLSEGIQTDVEARRIAQSTANRLGQSVYLYEAGFADVDADGDCPSCGFPADGSSGGACDCNHPCHGEVESEEIEPEPTTIEERIARAADRLDATELSDSRWAHHDDAMNRWYVVTADDLAELCDYLDNDDEQISKDAYSHWCAGTSAEEMPKGWSPELVDSISKRTADLSFITPPENQGQIVLVSYACDGDYIYGRTFDQSDRSTVVCVYEHPEADEDWEPQNGVPSTGVLVARVEVKS